jgi:hypothetical protein
LFIASRAAFTRLFGSSAIHWSPAVLDVKIRELRAAGVRKVSPPGARRQGNEQIGQGDIPNRAMRPSRR